MKVWLLSLTALAATAATRLELPDGKPGIGFDDLRYASALGKVLVPGGRSGRIDLVDPRTRAVTAVKGFSRDAAYEGGHDYGVTSADEGAGHLFATDRTIGKLVVVDAKRRTVVAREALGASPDYVRYVAATKEVWVTEPDKEQLEIFDVSVPAKPVRAATLEVTGGPESLVVDDAHGRAYTHLWKGQSVVFDVKSRKAVARWSNGCKGSRGIALDAAKGFLFAGCAEGKGVVVDVATGKLLSTLEVPKGVDVIDFNGQRRWLFLPSSAGGTLTIAAVSDKGQLASLRSVPTAVGAHCVTSDDQGNAYVCDPHGGALIFVAAAPP